MAVLNHLFLGILVLHIYVNGAPSDVGKLEDIAIVETTSDKLDSSPQKDQNLTNTTETTRKKRFYNHFNYGLPPLSPVIYPSFNRRDDFPGNFGMEDPLSVIHRYVQDIANFVRQPQQPPPFPHVPAFFPVLFIPPFDCNYCNPNNYQPTNQPGDQGIDQPIDQPVDQPLDRPTDQPINQPIDRPTDQRVDQPTDQPINQQINQTTDKTLNPVSSGEEFIPDTPNRFSQVDNNSDNKIGENAKRTPSDEKPDFTRPISFDPIPSKPTQRPQPAIEHGTVQSDDAGNKVPKLEDNDTLPPPPQYNPSHPTTSPPNVRPTFPPYTYHPPRPQEAHLPTQRPIISRFPDESELAPPTACDTATVTCCHQPSLHQCFIVQGCPNYSPNTCTTDKVLKILERIKTYYASKKGWFS